MFLSDWGRHEDQWRWATFKEDGVKVYRPIPRDRDQAYTKFDGLLVWFGKRASKLVYLQSIDYTIKDVRGYNYQARHLDRQLANEPSLQTWTSLANELQQILTDSIIDNSIKRLPPEVYPVSGAELATKLKSRRDHLGDFATNYYRVLAKDVDIAGTKQREVFEITGLSEDDIKVDIYDQDSEGNKKAAPFYSRTFSASETKEIRLYGIGGKDKYNIVGTTGRKTLIRLIGGPGKDIYNIPASFAGKVKVYDNKDNDFTAAESAKLKLSEDSSIHTFDYYEYKKGFAGLKPGISYTNEDRLYVTFGYRFLKQKWRKVPFGAQHDITANYSITQSAPSFQYKGIFNQAIGKWNAGILLRYDAVVDMHFPGIGNNSVVTSDRITEDFYRYRQGEIIGDVGIFRQFGKHHTVHIAGLFQAVKVLENNGKYISNVHSYTDPSLFKRDQFAGARADYNFETIDNKIFPTKGIRFFTGADFMQNLKQTDRNVARISGIFGFYVPIAPSLTLAVKTGAATLTGSPEFYQLNRLGGGSTLRGFLRYRFYGTSAVYNQNELQFNFNIKTYILSGKMGLLALFDNGRVWQPGETSDKWHTAFGGGLMLAPYNKISITGTYSVSKESSRLNVRIGKLI